MSSVPQASTTSTGNKITTVAGTTSTSAFTVLEVKPPTPSSASKSREDVEAAVYGYLRAMRALNRTKIGTAEVAKALNLSINQVNLTIDSLKRKGVKIEA